MKIVAFCLSILCLAVPIHAQSKKALAATLNRDLSTYKRYALDTNFDSMFQFMPPAMFDIIPRDSMIALMESSLNNENFSIEMTGFDYKGKPKIRKAGNYHWAFVAHEGRMKFHFKADNPMNKLMASMMKAQFGSENVRQESDGTLEISTPDKRLIAYKDPTAPIWWFVEDKRGEKGRDAALQKVIYEAIVPEAVRKAVGEKTK